ncbi:MAG: putative Outer-rane lipoprotein lolB precursor [Pseudomonadota bacterium]
MNRRASLRAAAAVASALALAVSGCALTSPAAPSAGPRWSGRLALQVQGDASTGFTASFELRGSPRQGELALYTPLGASAALLQWTPGRATLRAPGQPTREASSLDDLVAQATGTAIPVTALFDWLAGIPTAVAGWQADLSQHASGRLRARRLADPAADLRILLEQP